MVLGITPNTMFVYSLNHLVIMIRWFFVVFI